MFAFQYHKISLILFVFRQGFYFTFFKEKKTSKKKITQKMDGEVATDLQHSWPAKQQQKKGKQNKTESQPAHYTIETM